MELLCCNLPYSNLVGIQFQAGSLFLEKVAEVLYPRSVVTNLLCLVSSFCISPACVTSIALIWHSVDLVQQITKL